MLPLPSTISYHFEKGVPFHKCRYDGSFPAPEHLMAEDWAPYHTMKTRLLDYNKDKDLTHLG